MDILQDIWEDYKTIILIKPKNVVFEDYIAKENYEKLGYDKNKVLNIKYQTKNKKRRMENSILRLILFQIFLKRH